MLPDVLDISGFIEAALVDLWPPGKMITTFDARVVSLRGFSFKTGVFALEALVGGGGAPRAAAAARAAAAPALLSDTDILAALAAHAAAARAPAPLAWVRVAPALVARLSGLDAAACVRTSQLPKGDATRAAARAAMQAALGSFERALLARADPPQLRKLSLAEAAAAPRAPAAAAAARTPSEPALLLDFEIADFGR
jgi:hypothetical protein